MSAYSGGVVRLPLWLIVVLTLCLAPGLAQAQSSTYHLHQNASTTPGFDQLTTAPPDSAWVGLSSVDLQNQPAGEYVIKEFDTQAGVPNANGMVPAGSSLTFLVWMGTSAKNPTATLYPRVKIFLNSP